MATCKHSHQAPLDPSRATGKSICRGCGEIIPTVPYDIARTVDECPWISPCPTCGALCCLTVENSQVTGLSLSVDYACQRKHAPKVPP